MATAISDFPLATESRAATAERLAQWLIWINIIALAAVSLWFRLWQLGAVPGINGDEAWYGIEAMHWLNGEPVQWRTPTGNLMNLLYFGPLVLLHAFVEPSAMALRIPALISGLAALVVAWWLARRTFGMELAVTFTLILAVLPVNIAYSRFGWDASQTLLATLPVLLLPLGAMSAQIHRQRLLLAASICLALAMWVHPTNVFAAPLVVLPALWMWRDELRNAWIAQPVGRRRWVTLSCIIAAVVVAVLTQHWAIPMLKRLADPQQFGRFLLHYLRLFSGTTVYRFIAGSGLADDPWTSLAVWDLMLSDVVTALVAVAALATMWRQARRDWRGRDACLLASWGVMLIGFYLVAGAQGIQPHYERYGICLVAPAIVVLARAVQLHGRHSGRLDTPARTAGLALGWLLVLGFGSQYFVSFYRTGGLSHNTFRAGTVEPKQAALTHILRESSRDQVLWIVASEYWNERPLRYLASPYKRLMVVADTPDWPAEQLASTVRNRCLWFVEFAESPAYAETVQQLHDAGLAYEQSTIRDFAGRPILELLRATQRTNVSDTHNQAIVAAPRRQETPRLDSPCQTRHDGG